MALAKKSMCEATDSCKAAGEGGARASEDGAAHPSAQFLCWRSGRSCKVCGKELERGSPIAPVWAADPQGSVAPSAEGENRVELGVERMTCAGKIVGWGHEACCAGLFVPARKDRPTCKHWLRGKCEFGERCWFSHPDGVRGTQGEGQRAWGGRRRRLKNANKAAVFRRFICDTFGEAVICRGKGILDVAGGKGELAFQLSHLARIPAAVVDPRPLRLDQFRRRLEEGMFHRNAMLSPTLSAGAPSGSDPSHLRVFLDEGMLAAVDAAGLQGKEGQLKHGCSDDTWQATWASAVDRARSVAWTLKGLVDGHEDEGTGTKGHSERRECESCDKSSGHKVSADQDCSALSGDESYEESSGLEVEANEALIWLTEASLIVGLHPDQAAEPLVDLALKLGRPFAVVPCCTYYDEFPKRRGPDGQPVKTYEQLINYLAAKDCRIQRTCLDFEGKNVVLWLNSSTQPAESSVSRTS